MSVMRRSYQSSRSRPTASRRPPGACSIVIAPALVVAGHLRLARATAGASTVSHLGAAMLLMGLPFLALIVDSSTGVIAAVIVVFVIGEMLWMATSQALAAELAPPALRGTYFGALAAMTGPAWTLVPLAALQLRTGVGVAAVWLFFAIAAIAGAGVGVAAGRAGSTRRSPGKAVSGAPEPWDAAMRQRAGDRLISPTRTGDRRNHGRSAGLAFGTPRRVRSRSTGGGRQNWPNF
jgi:hypothetical protein